MNWSEILLHDKRTLINYKIRNIIRENVYKSSLNLLSNLTLNKQNQKNYINKNFIRKKYCDILNKFQPIKIINKKEIKSNNINNRYLKINNSSNNLTSNNNNNNNMKKNKTLFLLKNKKIYNNKNIIKIDLNKYKNYEKENFEKIRIENNQKYYKNYIINNYIKQSKKYLNKNEENKILNNLLKEKDFFINYENIKNIYKNLDKKYSNQKKILNLKKNLFLNNSQENFLNNYKIYDKSTDLLIKSLKIKLKLLKKLNELK